MRVIDNGHVSDPTGGRQDNNGDEAVILIGEFKDRLPHLQDLYAKAEAANADLKDAIKHVAEKSGLYASTIRTVIKALDKDKQDGVHRHAQQLTLVFEELEASESVSEEGARAAMAH